MCIRIWALRLEQGTPGLLVNKAFECAKTEKHQWVQNIRHLLYRNGFGYAWELEPLDIQANVSELRCVTKRLDQTTQNWQSQINTSRLKLLGKLKGHTYCQSGYLKGIKDIEARQTFTRLRLDMHVLPTSKCRKNTNPYGDNSQLCPLCKKESESVEHFLLRCPKFSDTKQNFINGIVLFEPNFNRMNNDKMLKTMLYLECKPEARHLVIEFITNIYKQRLSLTGGTMNLALCVYHILCLLSLHG